MKYAWSNLRNEITLWISEITFFELFIVQKYKNNSIIHNKKKSKGRLQNKKRVKRVTSGKKVGR